MDSQVSGIFRCCVEAIDAGVLIERESSKDKEFHFQNWFASGRSTGRKTMSRIAVFLIVLTLPLSAQTEQKSKPSRLESLFSKYELSSLNPEAIKRQIVDRGEPLTLEVYGRQFVFEMKPRDMRSQRYSAEATGENGLRQNVPPPPVDTFRGVTVGDNPVRGRFTITEDTFDGIIFTAGDWLYLEPVKNYLSESESGKTLIYADSDITHTEELQCGATSLHHGVKKMALPEQNALEIDRQTYYTAQVATEADYRYVRKIGSAAQANRLILSILNKVEGVYEDELNLHLEVVYQHTWTTNKDPYYWLSDSEDLLRGFQEHWNENFFHKDYDLAHMWTGSSALNGGIAWIGTVCYARYISYGLSSHIDHSRGSAIVAAHEIGHNFGADHPDEESPPIRSCTGKIMESTSSTWTELTFCQFSRDEIRSYVSDYNSCLDGERVEDPVVSQAPSGLTVAAVSSTQIRLNWQNNSSDTTANAISRKTVGGRWVWRATLRRDSTTFLDYDLRPSTSYAYRASAYLGDKLGWTNRSNVATAVTWATEDDTADLCFALSGDKDSQYEVVAFLTRYGGVKNARYKYLLQVALRNPTEHDLQYNARVLFRDWEGFVVEKAVIWNRDVPTPDLPIPAGEVRVFEDHMWAVNYLDPREVMAEVSITVLNR